MTWTRNQKGELQEKIKEAQETEQNGTHSREQLWSQNKTK